MCLDSMFNGGKKTFTIISMIVLLIGLIGELISSIIWWSRIQPWFSHGLKDGKSVYQSLLSCWVLSLIGTIVLLIFIIFTLFISSLCDSITGNSIVLIICVAIVGAISVGSIVSGAYAGSYGLKNPGEEDYDDYNNKCSKYINYGLSGIDYWLEKHPDKEDDYEKWITDLGDHIYDSENDKEDYGYLCIDVGIPTFVFALVQCVALILFIVDIILSCTSFAGVS